MLPVIAWMLAISTFVVGTIYIIQLVPRGILIFRLSNILNLHIYQGYTSFYDSLHDFITNINHSLLTLIRLSHFTENKHYIEQGLIPRRLLKFFSCEGAALEVLRFPEGSGKV